MKTIKYLFITLLTSTLLMSCSSDDDNPDPVNEEEVITTVILRLTPQGVGNTITLTSRDLDGDGPDAPLTEVSGSFVANTTYSGTIELLNETETPAEDITAEVQAEDEDHQIFYTLTNIGTISYADMDENGNPVGLLFTVQTAENPTTTSGILTVVLRHEPNKDAEGVSDGDITNAGGETDVSTVFTVNL